MRYTNTSTPQWVFQPETRSSWHPLPNIWRHGCFIEPAWMIRHRNKSKKTGRIRFIPLNSNMDTQNSQSSSTTHTWKDPYLSTACHFPSLSVYVQFPVRREDIQIQLEWRKNAWLRDLSSWWAQIADMNVGHRMQVMDGKHKNLRNLYAWKIANMKKQFRTQVYGFRVKMKPQAS